MGSDQPVYRFRGDVTREGPPDPADPLEVTEAIGLAQAAGVASFWIRKGIAGRVEVLDRRRLGLPVSRFDVRTLDEPRGETTYRVRTLDREHAVSRLDHAAQLRDALLVADEQLPFLNASVVVEISTGRRVVGVLTR